MANALYQIVYTSTAADTLAMADLMDLLKGSRARNMRAGITGLLLFKDGHFMQVLEGPETAVVPLFSKISRDPRHHHVIPLLHGRIQEREFSDSAMAFHHPNSAECRDLPGYSKFLDSAPDAENWNDISECRQLLLRFRKDSHSTEAAA